MAIYLSGISKCQICHKQIFDGEKRTSFTFFIDDENDPFWKYQDAVYHYDCFINWDEKMGFLEKYEASGHIWENTDIDM